MVAEDNEMPHISMMQFWYLHKTHLLTTTPCRNCLLSPKMSWD